MGSPFLRGVSVRRLVAVAIRFTLNERAVEFAGDPAMPLL